MRSTADALRSFKRHVALVLGDEWEVRLTNEEGAYTRPFARVSAVGDATYGGQAAYDVQIRQRFSVVCHPIEKATPDEAVLEAMRVEHLLFVGLRGEGPGYGRPKRIPLWNYDGVDVLHDVTDVPAEAAANPGLVLVEHDRRDFMRADAGDNPTVGRIQDSTDELLWVVTAAIPMWWSASVAVRSPGVTVERVSANPANPDPEA